MITVRFFRSGGFTVSGHAGLAPKGEDIICAAVSSAAYMTVNTLTDILGVEAQVDVEDGLMTFFPETVTPEAEHLIKGFELHIRALAKDNPNTIKVIYGGVSKCLK